MMEDKKVYFAGASERVRKALDEAGLDIPWPEVGMVDIESLAIEAKFYTGLDWEKLVLIDLRGFAEQGFEDEETVDRAVVCALKEAWTLFDPEEEAQLFLTLPRERQEQMGVPPPSRLVRDMEEQEEALEKFFNAAYEAFYHGE